MSTPEKWTLNYVACAWEVLDTHGEVMSRSNSIGEAVRLALAVAVLQKVAVEIVDGSFAGKVFGKHG